MSEKQINIISKETRSRKCPVKVSLKEDKINLEIDKEYKGDPSEIFQDITGTQNDLLAASILEKGSLNTYSKDSDANFNLALQALADMQPRDFVEARLILQANALYAKGMKYLQTADLQEMLCHREHYFKYGLKMLRLHNETVEALEKKRRGGEQRVVVQHVNVNEGGKAAFMTKNSTP